MNYKELVANQLKAILAVEEVSFETPKDNSFGDFAYPCFLLSKQRRQAPMQIAKEIEEEFNKTETAKKVKATATGPYLNFKIQDDSFVAETIQHILLADKLIKQTAEKTKVLVESPSPNTNKPLHIGHLRNILLGQSIINILKSLGKDVHLVNVINDRGIHICKSMLAYMKWGENKTPKDFDMKPDHFVGHWYVKFAQESAKSEEAKDSLEKEAKELLLKWEAQDSETIKVWEKMNAWAYEGFGETYKLLDFNIEKDYLESNTYKGGKDIIMQGVKDGIFYKDETGAIMVDLTDKKLDKKILLRADGSAVYITQDINLVNVRYKDYEFDEQIYIVGNEQEYHFKVLFEIFKLVKWPFAEKCKHFAYGMVELTSGKLKSREGNIIDTDELVNDTIKLAKKAVQERFPNTSEEEISKRGKIIGMGAIRFFYLKNDPVKNFVFDPNKSLAFEGETGPYVQYTHARICSILRKAGEETADLTLLQEEDEKHIVKELQRFQDVVEESSQKLKPNLVCHYLLGLCQRVNSYYSKHKVIQENKQLQGARCKLLSAVKKTISQGLALLDIKAPERM
jgi:arginyl-tRNA synthetase